MSVKTVSESDNLPCSPTEVDHFLSQPSIEVEEMLKATNGNFMVLGAGGKMGLHLCLMLRKGLDNIKSARKVYAVSRFSSVNDKMVFEDNGITTIAADLTDEEALKTLPDCENAYYMAGAKFGTSGNPGLLKLMNEELPKMVVKRFPHTRFVAFSTGCVYAFTDPASGGSTEQDPTDPPGAYAHSCLMREQAFVHASETTGTPSVLIRLNYSVEFRYGVLVDIAQKVLSGEPVSVDMGYVNLIWQRDAVDQIIRTLPLATTPARPLNITGGQIFAVRDLALRFGQVFDKEPVFSGVEAPTAWLNNAHLSHQLLGEPATPIDQMIDWVASWLQRGGNTHGKPTGFEKRDGAF